MKIFASGAVAGTLLVALLNATPASAQTRTWVSGVGDDLNPCSRTAPCRTFAGAISKTAAGGIINCLDPGGYGSVTITKSITIDCGGITGGGLAAGSPGVVVSGAGIAVILRGVTISGNGGGTIGINFVNGASLHVEDSTVTGFSNALMFVPPAGVTGRLTITNSSFSDSGGASINIAPSGSGIAKVTLDRVRADHNNAGFYALAGAGGRVQVGIKNSSFSENGFYGIAADGSGGPVQVVIDNSIVSGNGMMGVYSAGANALVFMCCSTFTGNDVGWSNSSGGGLFSYGNNNNNANVTSNGAANPAMQQ